MFLKHLGVSCKGTIQNIFIEGGKSKNKVKIGFQY